MMTQESRWDGKLILASALFCALAFNLVFFVQELLLTLPVPLWATVLGKYLAAWAFTGVALALTFPIWLTVNYLGSPDNGVIVASYIGSFLMAGGYLAIGACLSATTSNRSLPGYRSSGSRRMAEWNSAPDL